MKTTIGILIESLLRFHSELETFYGQLERDATDTRVTGLLNFLVRSERSQLRFVENFLQHTSRETLNSGVALTPATGEFPEVICPKGDRKRYANSYSDIMMTALRNETRLIRFCRRLSETRGNEHLGPVFKAVCRESAREKRNLFSYNYLFAS